MKLLITNGNHIVAFGNYVETETEYQYDGQIIPKHVVPDSFFVEIDVPEGFALGQYTYENGQLVAIKQDD